MSGTHSRTYFPDKVEARRRNRPVPNYCIAIIMRDNFRKSAIFNIDVVFAKELFGMQYAIPQRRRVIINAQEIPENQP